MAKLLRQMTLAGAGHFAKSLNRPAGEIAKKRASKRKAWHFETVEQMSKPANNSSAIRAQKWAARLMKSVNAVLKKHPHADPDNVRHTLILLEKPPLERLGRSLLRGRAITQRK